MSPPVWLATPLPGGGYEYANEATGEIRSTRPTNGRVVMPGQTIPDSAPATSVKGPSYQRLAADAEKLIGTGYTWGGETPQTGLDCSGFVQYLFGRQGINTPRVTQDQVNFGQPVTGSLKPGDVLFWDWGGGTEPEHTGIYIGDGQVIMASGRRGEQNGNRGGKVKIVGLDSYAKPSAARRYADFPDAVPSEMESPAPQTAERDTTATDAAAAADQIAQEETQQTQPQQLFPEVVIPPVTDPSAIVIPGTPEIGYTPRRPVAETWRLIAGQPFASPDTLEALKAAELADGF